MTEPGDLEPLRLSFEVQCTPEHAFEVWAARTSGWWPTSHTVSAEADVEVVFEPRAGGRIYERTSAGVEHDWGAITAWEPPRRLVYQWHLRQDQADATEVEVRFLPAQLEGRSTLVEIEHRGWERLGDRAEARRNANYAGWGGLLPHFIEAARQSPRSRRGSPDDE